MASLDNIGFSTWFSGAMDLYPPRVQEIGEHGFLVDRPEIAERPTALVQVAFVIDPLNN